MMPCDRLRAKAAKARANGKLFLQNFTVSKEKVELKPSLSIRHKSAIKCKHLLIQNQKNKIVTIASSISINLPVPALTKSYILHLSGGSNYHPSCTKEGYCLPVQCREKFCWCTSPACKTEKRSLGRKTDDFTCDNY